MLALLTTAIVCLAAGFAVGWVVLRTKVVVLKSSISGLRESLQAATLDLSRQRELVVTQTAELATARTSLEQGLKASEEKLALLTSAREDLRNAFGTLAADALQSNNSSFLDLAHTKLGDFQNQAESDLGARQKAVADLVGPLRTALETLDSKVQQLELHRAGAYAGLTKQVDSLLHTQEQLRAETGNLVRALRSPAVRGRWGEIQLKRVVEIADMLSYCDFTEQKTVQAEGGRLRPDLVVRLPGGKNVVVDAKTPLEAYLNAMATTDEEAKRAYLLDHARQVRAHLERLGSKGYWEQFEPSPEFVVMFLPGESFFSAALELDPALIEHGVSEQVIPASPTTLIALLRAVAYGWRQENLAENAQQISNLGKELHDRVGSLIGHFENLGGSLHKAVDCYNKVLGSLESRVLVSTRKFAELGAPVTELIPELHPIETTTRQVSPELRRQSTIFVEKSEDNLHRLGTDALSGQELLDLDTGTANSEPLPLIDKASA